MEAGSSNGRSYLRTLVANSTLVKLASWSISHPLNYVVTLGTPVNWDLAVIYAGAIGHFCQVSSLADEIQFSGASPALQLYPFGQDQYETALWLDQEAQDLYYGYYDYALDDAAEAAYYEADAYFWWMTTKLDPFAWNVLYTDLSHSDLHTAAVWNNVKRDCGLSN